MTKGLSLWVVVARLVFVAALSFSGFASGSQVSLGSWSYSTSGGTVNLSVSKLSNDGTNTTGTLRLRLYATRGTFSPGMSGYQLAVFDYFDPLTSRRYYYDITRSDNFQAAPADGIYYTITLLAEEYDSRSCTTSDHFCVVAYSSATTTWCFGNCNNIPTVPRPPVSIEGGRVIVTDASRDIHVTCEGKNASYSHYLYLNNSSLFICDTANKGTINIGRYSVGTELVFKLSVRTTGYEYYTGAASRNPDGRPHTAIYNKSDGSVLIGMEDLYSLGDGDYNDAVFSIGAGVAGYSSSQSGCTDSVFDWVEWILPDLTRGSSGSRTRNGYYERCYSSSGLCQGVMSQDLYFYVQDFSFFVPAGAVSDYCSVAQSQGF